MSIVEDTLDFLVFLFFLGLCLAVAFGVIIPIVHDSSSASSVGIVNKTAPKAQGSAVTTSFDGTYSSLDIVLMSQVQDFEMPEPKRFVVQSPVSDSKVDIDIADIGVLYETDYNQQKYANQLANLLSVSGVDNHRYVINYFNGASGLADDYYIIEKKK